MKAESATTQSLLREATQKKISYLLSKRAIKDVEVYVLIKDFFKEYLHAHYEFTFDELAKELKETYIERHIKEALYRLLEDFSTIEYKDEEVPQEVLQETLRTFSRLVDDLIKQQATEKKGFFDRLFGKKEQSVPAPAQENMEEPPGQQEQAAAAKDDDIPAAPPAQAPPSSFEEQPAPAQENMEEPPGQQEQAAAAKDDDVPAAPPAQEQEPPVQDGFQVPSLSQEDSPAQEPPAQEDEHKQKSSVFPEDALPGEEGSGSGAGIDWTEPADHENSGSDDDDDVFPFNDEASQEESSQTTPQPTRTGEGSDEEPQQDPEEPSEAAPREEQAPEQEQAAVTQAPAQEAPQAATQAPQQSRDEVYFGSDEEELSADLNKLAEQLDEVIRDEDLKPQAGSVSEAEGLGGLITETERLIVERRFDEAQTVYKELVGRYHGLSEEEKHAYYEKVQHLYDLLQQR